MRPPSFFSSTSVVCAAIPDLDRAGPVLPGRDLALEVRVVERVVLDVDGEMPFALLERHALRHGPAGERAVALEPEVVVEPPGGMALHDEAQGRALPASPSPERLGRLARIPLLPVGLERHSPMIAHAARARNLAARYRVAESAPPLNRFVIKLLSPLQIATFTAGDKPVESVERGVRRRRPWRGTSRAAPGAARPGRSRRALRGARRPIRAGGAPPRRRPSGHHPQARGRSPR